MRLETIPLVLGGAAALLGILFLLDAWAPDDSWPGAERRRRERIGRHLVGEAMLGAGLIATATTLLGRDTWRWGTVAALVAVVFIVAGTWLNRAYLLDLLRSRGPARRRRNGPRRGGPRRREDDRSFRIR